MEAGDSYPPPLPSGFVPVLMNGVLLTGTERGHSVSWVSFVHCQTHWCFKFVLKTIAIIQNAVNPIATLLIGGALLWLKKMSRVP